MKLSNFRATGAIVLNSAEVSHETTARLQEQTRPEGTDPTGRFAMLGTEQPATN